MPVRHATKPCKKANPVEFNAWMSMRKRCNNSNAHNYHRYGGRGIKVCKRWQGANGFANFFADMGPRPSNRHSLDREDNEGNYTPTNCRWAVPKVQSRNRGDNHWITWKGGTKCLAEWSEILGMSAPLLNQRIAKWGVDVAFTRVKREYWRMLAFDGRTQSLSDWAREMGLKRKTLERRIKYWGLEKAMRSGEPTGPGSKGVQLECDGESMTLSQWAKKFGVPRQSFASQMRGKGLAEAIRYYRQKQGG